MRGWKYVLLDLVVSILTAVFAGVAVVCFMLIFVFPNQ